jgi:hypothetical protein
MKRSEIQDRGGAAAYPRHPSHAHRLPRFNAVQTPDPGFRDAASGLRQATPGFHHVGRGRKPNPSGVRTLPQFLRARRGMKAVDRHDGVATDTPMLGFLRQPAMKLLSHPAS